MLIASCSGDDAPMAGAEPTANAGAGGRATEVVMSHPSTGGSAGNVAAGSGGNGGESGASKMMDGSTVADTSTRDAPADTTIDTGVADPGTDGDGDFVIGPSYQDAPELTANPMAPKGTVFAFTMDANKSTVYPGDFQRGVWVYVPKQYTDGVAAPFIVAQDGGQYGPGGQGYTHRLPTVLDNMIFAKKLPVIIAVMINPGPGDGQGSERGLEYDTVSDVYASFIEKEALPAVQNDAAIRKAYPNLSFTTNPEGRSTLGCSSGGAASFTMGWFRPDLYRRLTTYSGTFVDQDPKNPIYPHGAWSYGEFLVRDSAPKPLRVFLTVGENDNNLDSDPRFNNDMMHNWMTANKMLAAALKAKGYHYRFLFARGAGHCDDRVQAETLPETLLWMWRGYPIE
jgi:enterochelin esterase-like enzyme